MTPEELHQLNWLVLHMFDIKHSGTTTCTDINECAQANGGCEGSYEAIVP